MLENTWREQLTQKKKWLILAVCFTFFWGLLAHGYAMTNALINHDALAEFYGEYFGNAHKVGLGRFLVPFYQKLFRVNLAIPWLVGVLSLLWLSVAVFLTLEIFDIRSRVTAFLIAGIYSVNLAVIATWGSYLHDLDADMFGVMAAVAAVYCWRKLPALWGTLLGAMLTVVPLATYQSNFSVVIELVLIASILDLVKGGCFTQVMKSGLRAILMVLLGGLLYYGMIPIVTLLTGISLRSGDYNTLDNMKKLSLSDYLSNLKLAYQEWYCYLHFELNPYPCKLFNGPLALVSFGAGGLWLLDRKASPLSKLLCAALVCLLPLSAMLAHVVQSETFHDLMTYPIWLVYLLPLLLGTWLCRRLELWGRLPKAAAALPRAISVLMVFVFLYGNVQMANALYLKKDLEAKAFQSLMTQVISDVEKTPGYVPGQTQVAFLGTPDQLCSLPGTSEYRYIVGMQNPGPVVSDDRLYYQAYMNYIILRPIEAASVDDWCRLKADPRVAAMPVYPEEGAIAFVDDVLVIHMGASK